MYIGIDSMEFQRMSVNINNPKFLEKYFTNYEIEYSKVTVNGVMRLAGIFCAKEAFLKAIEFGIGGGIDLKEIEIKHKKSGAPYIVLSEHAQKIIDSLKINEIKVSITHTSFLSTAVCLCY